jgi:hypothetical protein
MTTRGGVADVGWKGKSMGESGDERPGQRGVLKFEFRPNTSRVSRLNRMVQASGRYKACDNGATEKPRGTRILSKELGTLYELGFGG